MRSEYSFFWASLLGLLIPVAVLFALPEFVLGAAPEKGRWVAEIVQKKTAAAAARQPPNYLLGGSNVLFDYSAQQLTEQYGIPTVNLGLHAGLGLPYILDFGRRFFRPGVTFIMPIEYALYGNPPPESAYQYQVLGYDKDYWRQMTLGKRVELLTTIGWTDWGRMVANRIVHDGKRSDGYQSNTLNDFGDETGNTPERRSASQLQYLSRLGCQKFVSNPESAQLVADFARDAAQHQARLVLTYPATLQNVSCVSQNQAFLEQLAAFMKAHDIPLIGSAEAHQFPPEYAFDTPYHEVREGQQVSTRLLATELKQSGIVADAAAPPTP